MRPLNGLRLAYLNAKNSHLQSSVDAPDNVALHAREDSGSSMFADTPEPPYFAVVFSSQRTDTDHAGYERMAARMVELAAEQPGYLGIESSRDAAGFGISVSYWSSEQAVLGWKANVEHLAAQELGRSLWYAGYRLRVACVERAYGFESDLE